MKTALSVFMVCDDRSKSFRFPGRSTTQDSQSESESVKSKGNMEESTLSNTSEEECTLESALGSCFESDH